MQIFFALVNQGEVVHISDVVFDVQALFDEVIHVIEHSQLHKLADLASEPNSDITAKAVDHVAGVVCRALILHALSHGGLCHVMPCGIEVVVYVAFQYPSIRSVFDPVFAHVSRDSVETVVYAFADLAGYVVSYECARDLIIQNLLAQRSLHLAVANACR